MQYDGYMFKSLIQRKLQKYVVKYFKKHPEVQLVAVVGSVGKTSTKRALADILSQRFRVRMHEGNHNTDVSAPLAILGIDYPSNIRNPLSWLAVFRAARLRIKQPSDVDVVIQELGVDHPGDMKGFGKYLHPNIALITAITPEHMEFFGTLDAVAREEMAVSDFSDYVLINRDDVDFKYADFEANANFSTYGTSSAAEHYFEHQEFTPEAGYYGTIVAPEYPKPIEATINVVGEHSLRPIIGAVAVAAKLGMAPSEISKGLELITPVPGRMNLLKGMGGTLIIDDTYNSSPAAAAAALQALYSFDQAPQRIAVLGDMRELGATSAEAHRQLGALCDPNSLAWVVLVGPEMQTHLGPVAKERGCQVHNVKHAIEAGEFVRSVDNEGTVVLVKGSQNTIFLEEAVKVLCELDDNDKLVRQSPTWMETKQKYFNSL